VVHRHLKSGRERGGEALKRVADGGTPDAAPAPHGQARLRALEQELARLEQVVAALQRQLTAAEHAAREQARAAAEHERLAVEREQWAAEREAALREEVAALKRARRTDAPPAPRETARRGWAPAETDETPDAPSLLAQARRRRR